MTRLSVNMFSRDFSTLWDTSLAVLTPKTYSWSAIGGPKQAEIVGTGSEIAIWEAVEWLRNPIQIYDDQARNVWWGYVSDVRINVGRWQLGVSLDSMVNRLAVAYTLLDASAAGPGDRATTAWVQNDDSVSTYGMKETLLSFSDATESAANKFRDAALEIGKYPVPLISKGSGSELSFSLGCRGWWDTFAWKHYAADPSAAGFTLIQGTPFYATMDTINGDAWAQTFQLDSSTSVTVSSIKIRLGKTGSPTRNVRVSIWTNGSGAPGTELCNATINVDDIPTDVGWVEASITSGPTLVAATTYWLKFELVGSGGTYDYDNQIMWHAAYNADATYALGQMYDLFGSTWTAVPTSDLYFAIGGIMQTTSLISDLVDVSGQFIVATDFVEAASGVFTVPYQDGDSTALQVIESLLAMGSTTAYRYLATVGSDRRISIWPEPARPTSLDQCYKLRSDGRFFDLFDVEVPPHMCPVGMWVRLRDVIPGTTDLSKLADPTLQFIEENEYDVSSNTCTPTARGVKTVWDL